MTLSWKARRRCALVILLLGLPVYIAVAAQVVSALERPPVWAELLIYLALGVLWVLPFRAVFRGVAKADPNANREPDRTR